MLKVVVVSLGSVSEISTDLKSTLALARSSALYADEIAIFSPWSEIAIEVDRQRRKLTTEEVLAALGETRPDLRDLVTSSPDRDLLLRRIAESVGQGSSSVSGPVREIEAAIARGYLTARPMAEVEDERLRLREFIDQLVVILADPAVHAVCDREAGAVVQALHTARPELAARGASRPKRRAELGAGLIARLPAFPSASLDELLDLKSDLAGPLDRYRTAVERLESNLAWDPASLDIEEAVTDVWTAEVKPVLADLEDALTEHGLVRELARSTATSVRDLVVGGASLSIAVSTVGHVATSIAAAAGIAGAGLQAATTGAMAQGKAVRDRKRNDFYYLLRLAQVAAQSQRG